jgi:hypothetical protein
LSFHHRARCPKLQIGKFFLSDPPHGRTHCRGWVPLIKGSVGDGTQMPL